MIANIIITLWIAFVLMLVAMILYRIKTKNYQCYLFQNYNVVGIPYITLDVQGHPLNLIVDSGAAVSVITQEALGYIAYEPCMRRIEISATTDESIPANMVTIPFNVNGLEIKEDFVVHFVDDLANFKAQHNLMVHGILGNEFFEKTGCKIDYRKHTVTLY